LKSFLALNISPGLLNYDSDVHSQEVLSKLFGQGSDVGVGNFVKTFEDRWAAVVGAVVCLISPSAGF
jgi:hypothetical protein